MAESYSNQSNQPTSECSEHHDSSQTLNNKAIFRRLISQEIRNGRLSTYRRRRIVQYAAHLGISAVDMGKMIEHCSQKCFEESMQKNAQPDIRLVKTSAGRSYSAIITCLVGLSFILSVMAYIAFVD